LKGRPRHRWEDNIRMDIRVLVLGNSIGIGKYNRGSSVVIVEAGR
jgi:hypothetical protein